MHSQGRSLVTNNIVNLENKNKINRVNLAINNAINLQHLSAMAKSKVKTPIHVYDYRSSGKC